MNKFTSYKVNTTVLQTHSNFPFQSSSVIRRYSDFVWLVSQLLEAYPGCIVPPLPEKQAVSRFSPEFVESRRRQLDKFIVRVSEHEELINSECLAVFLSADDVAFGVRKTAGSGQKDAGKGGESLVLRRQPQ